MNIKQKSEWGELAAHGLILLMGIYFIWQKDQALIHMVILLAAAMAIFGISGLVRWIFTKPRPDPIRLVSPIFIMVAALVIFLLRAQITGFVPMLIGILSLGAGIFQTVTVLRSGLGKEHGWWLHAPTAVLWLVLGILVLTGVINVNAVFMFVMGIVLTVAGVLGAAESIAALGMRKE